MSEGIRRVALVATPIADADPQGLHGSLDGDAVRVRLAQEDAGFEVHDLDPTRDLAEQLDEVFDGLGDDRVDAVFYASSPVVLAPDGELFLCLDPREIETGDALDELASVFAERGAGRRLFVLDCRYPSSNDPLRGVTCMESIQQRLRGRAEVLAAARPTDQVRPGEVSPLTRAVLRALDDEEPGHALATKRIHERIVEEAIVAGEVRALAYLSHGTSMSLLLGEERGDLPSAGTETGGEGPPAAPEEEPRVDATPAAVELDERSRLASISVVPVRTPVDGQTRTTSLRIGADARVRAQRHLVAARELAAVGAPAAAVDELRRASLLAPPEVRSGLARERARVTSTLEPTAALAAADAAIAMIPDDAELLGLRARALARLDADPTTRRDAEERWEQALGDDAPPVEVLIELRAAAVRAGEPRGVGRWTRRLAERTSAPRARARLLREAAASLEAAGQRDEAAAALESALEADPTQLGALDALIRLLAPAERWSYLAAMVRRLAGRCAEVAPEALARSARVAILGRLGGLLRDRMSDPRRALAAFEEALADEPRDASLHLAALLVAIDAGDAPSALGHVEAAARAGSLDLDLVQRLRQLLVDAGHAQAAERAAIVAEALGAEDEATLAAAAAAIVPGSPARPLGPVGRAAWLGDEIAPPLEAFLAIVTPAAAAARLEQLGASGGVFEDAGAPAPPPEAAVSRAVTAAARILGADVPRLVIVPEGRVPLRVPPSGEAVVVASADATDGLPPRELAFLAGRAVASLVGPHLLAGLYAEPTDLDALVLGAAAAASPAISLEPAWAEPALALRAALEPWLGEDELTTLATATEDLAAADLPLDGEAWLRAVERRLDRAGLLVCGDVLAAVSVVAREDGDGERLDDLLGFYLSSRYEAVLREVGGSMLPPPALVEPPIDGGAPAPRSTIPFESEGAVAEGALEGAAPADAARGGATPDGDQASRIDG